MLLILAPFAFIGELIGGAYLLKIPLFLSDLIIFFILLRLFPEKHKNILLFYFLNPIIIYATYIHSQLDIIPTALIFISVYQLTQENLRKSAIFFGLAMATKLHVIIAFPLILFYLFKKFKIQSALIYGLISLLILFVFDLPFLFSEGFYKMTIFNPKQTLLLDTFYNIGSLKLILPVGTILMIYFHFFNQNKVNNDLLYFYFGLLFTATFFFVYPGPAWYVWMIPFVVIYFIKNKNFNKTLILHITFSFAYLSFFIFFYESSYNDIIFLENIIDWKIKNENLKNISFTILEAMLLAIIYSFFIYGIKSNSIYNKQTNLTIGIGGDSGVGKTTFLKNLKDLLGDNLLQIEGDGEHKWERGNKNWKKYTHLDPKANHIHKQADALLELKNNNSTFRSEYNHKNGTFTKPLKIQPKEFIVIAGLHTFYLPKIRKILDLKIFIDTDESLRRHWKILRDTKKRGHKVKNILSQIENRMSDAKKYIYPQRNFADIVVCFFPLKPIKKNETNVELGLRISFDANIHVEEILQMLDIDYKWDYNNDLKTQFIEVKSNSKSNFKIIANNTVENINEIISSKVKWNSGFDGLIQLISLKMISEKLKN